MATVDVIIPAFNSAKYLAVALESVHIQTFDDWHIVLVDDGSTDETADVVAPFLARFGSKMTYIRQTNRGLPAARNVAISASTSEFLALLDADDVWLPCRLSKSIDQLTNLPEAGLAYGRVKEIDPEGNVIRTWLGNATNSEGHIAPQIYTRKVDLPCPTITFRRRCVEEVGLFDETMRSTEDRDLWMRIALRYQVTFIPEILACYRVSPFSMSANSDRMVEAQLQFLRKHYGSKGCGPIVRQIATARVYKQRAEALMRKGQLAAAVKTALKAMILCPFDLDNVRTAGSLSFAWLRQSFRESQR